MTRHFMLLSVAFANLAVHAASVDRTLDERIRSEVDHAISSGIAGVSGSVSGSRVWVAVTPALSEIFEREPAPDIMTILRDIEDDKREAPRRGLRSYVSMCLMVFPEREHDVPSTIDFPGDRHESVVYYKFSLERFLGRTHQ